MNINGGFFSDTEGDALAEMQKMVSCKVKRCAYPTTKNLTYYLSEHGDLFSIQKIQGKLLTRVPDVVRWSRHCAVVVLMPW